MSQTAEVAGKAKHLLPAKVRKPTKEVESWVYDYGPLGLIGEEVSQDVVDIIYYAHSRRLCRTELPDGEELSRILEREGAISEVLELLKAHRYSEHYRVIKFDGEYRLMALLRRLGERYPQRTKEILAVVTGMYDLNDCLWAHEGPDIFRLITVFKHCPDEFLSTLEHCAQIGDKWYCYSAQRALANCGEKGREILKRLIRESKADTSAGVVALSQIEENFSETNPDLRMIIAERALDRGYGDYCAFSRQHAAAAFGKDIWLELITSFSSANKRSSANSIPIALAFIGEIEELIKQHGDYNAIPILGAIAIMAQPEKGFVQPDGERCLACWATKLNWELGTSVDWVITMATSKDQNVRLAACLTLYQLIRHQKLSYAQLECAEKLLEGLPAQADIVEQSHLMTILQALLERVGEVHKRQAQTILQAIYHSLNLRYGMLLGVQEACSHFAPSRNTLPGFQGGFHIHYRPEDREECLSTLDTALTKESLSRTERAVFEVLLGTYRASRAIEFQVAQMLGTVPKSR